LGTAFGLVLGKLFHSFFVKSVDSSNLMLLRYISSMSYLVSALLTLLFALIVNLIMLGKLKKIEMVESMKAIE